MSGEDNWNKPDTEIDELTFSCEGIPIRLEIASRLLQMAIVSEHCPNPQMHYEAVAKQALINADILIAAHKETYEKLGPTDSGGEK